LAALALCAPALAPHHESYSPPTWGILTTVLTTVAIVSAARLPELDHALCTKSRPATQLFLWMSLPVARFSPSDPSARSKNRKRALRYLFWGAVKRLSWEPFAFVLSQQDGGAFPWPVRSAVLMLYFVLNVTATADFASAFCLLLGVDVDDIFDAPLWSQSPRDFWSRRWNKFINRFALKHVALPIGRRFTPSAVILVVFATSGAFHEYFAWGVGKEDASYGSMMLFFSVQGAAVWLGEKVKIPALPHALKTALTFAWMMLTAPLFFAAVQPALHAFGYPESWLPF
jgi:D-alanyl-lipoteichoic acid acyltransferase DltB (MBOAT superfamily)